MDRVTVRPAAPAVPSGPILQILPPGAPLDMPVQSLTQDTLRGARRRFADSRVGPRLAVIGLTSLATAGAVEVMLRLLRPEGINGADQLLLGLFAVLFAWVAFAMVSATAGFVLIWRARDLEPWRPQPLVFTRTALLMPTYNEDPGRVLAGVQAIHEDLAARGVAELYDIFILSDTRQAAIAREEVAGVLRLRARLAAGDRIFYFRRACNTDRKAGNVADWVRRFGGAYEAMIILDADSLMSGDTIVRLTAALASDPRCGLIQTLPSIIGARTLFGRLQQFAGRVYGPVIAQGQAWWSGAEGNYWGHNAIVRTRAFADCAGLPHIGGVNPFRGHIMSHDFVEAALLRRGGWAVRMAPALSGSFEETPPSLIDMALRDRRWCQGNLQHAAVLAAQGLHWVSRLHLARGVLAYLTAPLWMAFLAIGGVVWAQQQGAAHVLDAPLAGWLFAATMTLLLAPKLMGAALVARNRLSRRASGGGGRLVLGVGLEIVASALLAPVFMLMQSCAVADVLRGRHSGWSAQQRDEEPMTLAEAWGRHRGHTLIGVAWTALAGSLDPALLAWTSPVALGLLLSAPVSMLTSRTDLGEACRRVGLFLTPEETSPPTVMARAAQLRAQYAAEAPMRRQIERLMRTPVAIAMPTARQVRVLAPAE